MQQDGASRPEPDDDWRLDLDRPEQVMEVLRRASAELVKADSKVEAAEARTRALEQELAQTRTRGDALLREAADRCAELEAGIDGERTLLSEQLEQLRAAHEEAQDRAAAEYRAIEQRAIQAELLSRMVQERNARLEQQIAEAEDRSERFQERARRAEQRLEQVRAAFEMEVEPAALAPRIEVPVLDDSPELQDPPVPSRPAAKPVLDAVATTAAQGLSRASGWVRAGLQVRPPLRVSQVALGCAAFLALAGVGAAALLGPTPPAPPARPVQVAAADAGVGWPAARPVETPPRPEPLATLDLELPPPAEPVRQEAFLTEPPAAAPLVLAELPPLPPIEESLRLDLARADLVPAEAPAAAPPEKAPRRPAKTAAKTADAQGRALARPPSNKLPQPAN